METILMVFGVTMAVAIPTVLCTVAIILAINKWG